MQDVTIDRNKYIGGSDIPIIMGISPFKSRFDLLLEKAGLKENDFTGNEYTEYGNVLEPKIREYINEKYQTNFVEDKLIKEDIRCHFDGVFRNSIDNEIGTILEIKTTSQVHDNLDDYEVYLVQLLFYMYNANCKNGVLAVYERPKDFNEEFDSKRLKVYSVDLDDYSELVEEIKEAVNQFRIDLAKLKENPFLSEEDLLSNDLVSLSKEVVRLENELATLKEVEKKLKELKEQLKLAMQKNNVKKWETPSGIKITLVEDTPDKEIEEEYFDKDKFKEEYPMLCCKYEETRKVIKKGKSGYVKITL